MMHTPDYTPEAGTKAHQPSMITNQLDELQNSINQLEKAVEGLNCKLGSVTFYDQSCCPEEHAKPDQPMSELASTLQRCHTMIYMQNIRIREITEAVQL